jgi:glucose-1-phosphate cytidylyltransferase
MKVVLFCGGQGMRLRNYPGQVPKPMIDINGRPILWHLMKYYAHFGHKDFILCLGYKGNVIKSYFRNYDECLTNDFILSDGGQKLDLYSSDIHDWRITFANTGMQSNIAQRLLSVRKYLEGEDMFLANYSDGLIDLPLAALIDFFKSKNKVACFVSVPLSFTCHVVSMKGDSTVADIRDAKDTKLRINGGFFVFKREIFNYIGEGEELVHEPFQRLIRENQLLAYEHNGFWKCMDTFAQKREFDQLVAAGTMPWELWKPAE